MPMIKTSDLTGAALDWAVAVCEGFTDYDPDTETMMPPRKGYGRVNFDEYSYSTDWAHGGPIIEREQMHISCWPKSGHSEEQGAAPWYAQELRKDATCADDYYGHHNNDMSGPTILVAAMRCYCASRLGDTIDIPSELI